MTERMTPTQPLRDVFAMHPADAVVHPDVTPRAQYSGSGGIIVVRTLSAAGHECGRWYVGADDSIVIADRLEEKGLAVAARNFRQAARHAIHGRGVEVE